MNEENKAYSRFTFIFHIIILIFGIFITAISIASWNTLDRSGLYLLLAIVFMVESIIGIYRNYPHRSRQ